MHVTVVVSSEEVPRVSSDNSTVHKEWLFRIYKAICGLLTLYLLRTISSSISHVRRRASRRDIQTNVPRRKSHQVSGIPSAMTTSLGDMLRSASLALRQRPRKEAVIFGRSTL